MPAHDLARESIAPDEAAVTAEFIEFLQAASLKRHPTGTIPRFNQGRATGCVDAEFTVAGDLPDDLRVGIFRAARTYRAWIRFANASSTSDRERDVRGMSIKLLAVEGKNLTESETSQDFVLNSHPVMMVPRTREFLELLRAVNGSGLDRALYFLRHPGAARIALVSRQNPTSHLDIRYWSTTPYLFGEGRAVKYIVQPLAHGGGSKVHPTGDTYLRDALRDRLRAGDAAFDFMIQFQTDSRTMPIEDATVEWKERDSPYRTVARIRIPRQDIDVAGRELACERTSFNPWHSLVEHRPLGSLNRARREIYQAMARFREARFAQL